MSQSTFFAEHPLPVFEYLSHDSKCQLEAYLLTGNTGFRKKRLLDFFKTVDWVSDELALQDHIPQKISPALRQQLKREIRGYHLQKAEKRIENAEKREQYKLRIIEYFRATISAADKALLESLRDYELDLTGRDVNWRHYFTLDSFKKIDTFVQATHAERQLLFEQFKKDVETYKRNYEKIHQIQNAKACEHAFSFDDWCEAFEDEIFQNANTRTQNNAPKETVQNTVYQAYQTLEVAVGAAPELVKKQFRRLTLQYHPDLSNGSEEKMKIIISAYQELQRYWQTSCLQSVCD